MARETITRMGTLTLWRSQRRVEVEFGERFIAVASDIIGLTSTKISTAGRSDLSALKLEAGFQDSLHNICYRTFRNRPAPSRFRKTQKTVEDDYDRIGEEIGFRKQGVEKIGLGFDLPSAVVPNVPSSDVGLGKEIAVTF